MSVQNGRCVVTFNQNNQEVVKGVADYLRYAGEERIKKWRRHVRMVGEYLITHCFWGVMSGGRDFSGRGGEGHPEWDR
jgi:hypothetical protein